MRTNTYSLGWCHFERFKPARAESRTNFDITQAEGGGLDRALAYVAHLECDYWETGHFRTAGFTGIDARLAWYGQQENRQDILHVLGICANAKECQQRLMEHPKIQQLLEATRNKTIRIGLPGELIVVNDEVVEQMWELMNLAIRQALAGPHKDSERWIEEQWPVSEKVDRIYRDLLNARNRVIAGRRKREVGGEWLKEG